MSMKVLLVDDHDVVRSGFRSLLQKQSGIEVVGEASDGREAVHLAKALRPDVIVMDVAMPGLNGVDATRQITHGHPETRVLALSMHPGRRVVTDMLRAGASGYLLKTCALEELIRAVGAVADGRTYLSPDIAGTVVEGYVRQAANEVDGQPGLLSDRERRVLKLVAEGLTTKAIAANLGVTVKTIEAHRHNIMDKLNLRSVAELTKCAIREGLTPLEN